MINKRKEILQVMETGQTTLADFVKCARSHFKYITLIWNSANFYHIVASDDLSNLNSFLQHLSKPYFLDEFANEPLGFLYEQESYVENFHNSID